MRISRRTFVWRGLAPIVSASFLLPELTGCGSILYPERVGQPRGGPLDWKVVALDGLGLLLFFIPGLVAFVVDFHNGTIFLPTYYVQSPSCPACVAPPVRYESYLPPPPNSAADDESRTWHRSDFETIDVPPEQLTREHVEQLVSERVGKRVTLQDETARIARLSDLADFGDRRHQLSRGHLETLPLDRAFQNRG